MLYRRLINVLLYERTQIPRNRCLKLLYILTHISPSKRYENFQKKNKKIEIQETANCRRPDILASTIPLTKVIEPTSSLPSSLRSHHPPAFAQKHCLSQRPCFPCFSSQYKDSRPLLAHQSPRIFLIFAGMLWLSNKHRC